MAPSTLPLRPAPANLPHPAAPALAAAPLLVDALEAARLLGVSPRTLWGLTKRGEVKAKRIGRRVLYARSALEEFARR